MGARSLAPGHPATQSWCSFHAVDVTRGLISSSQRPAVEHAKPGIRYRPMTSTSIRTARPSEIEAARSVLNAAYSQYQPMFPEGNWVPYVADILDIEGRSDVSELLIAERKGAIVGCVSFYPPGAQMSYPSDDFSQHWPREWAAIRLLAVDPSARGEGIGRALPTCVSNDQWLQALRRSDFTRRRKWPWPSRCTGAWASNGLQSLTSALGLPSLSKAIASC